MQQFLFSYDDICLKPKHSVLSSRSEANTLSEFLGLNFKLPVVPANMLDVISVEKAKELGINQYFYIMHRFGNAYEQISNEELGTDTASISVGVKDEDKRFLDSLKFKPSFITIDVAHADHDNVKEMAKFIRNRFPLPKNYNADEFMFIHYPRLIIGNVATADGYKFLCDLGAEAVKVGIGGGSICTTRYKTGFHIPTAYAVWDCATNGERDIPIIADGGAKHFGDVAKALVLGADMVMSGQWFAECIDSPAQIEHGKKIYRGSTSYKVKGHNNHIEGQTLEIDRACTYAERLIEIQQALQSSISYGGGNDLSCFNSVEWFLCH
jgi:GMP reductase